VDVGGYDFTRACEIDADRASDGALMLDTPHGRYANAKSLPLHAYGEGPFVRLRLANLPVEAGVYAVVGEDAWALYVGRARDSIRQR